MRIFDDKIQAQVVKDQITAREDMDNANKPLDKEIEKLKKIKKQYDNRVDSAKNKRDSTNQAVLMEASGHGLSGKVGVGYNTKKLERMAEEQQKDFCKIQAEADSMKKN